MNQKLISITRADLTSGYQAVQSSHALIDFCFKYPDVATTWHNNSNYLCQVVVKNEDELKKYVLKANKKGIKVVEFYEPDLENQLTAIALEPSNASKKLISNLPLMLKNHPIN